MFSVARHFLIALIEMGELLLIPKCKQFGDWATWNGRRQHAVRDVFAVSFQV